MTVVAAGITLFEALKAYEQLKKENILIRVIDLYSVKPLDENTLKKAARNTKAVLTVEDHYQQGGIGEAVRSALSQEETPVFSLAVTKIPKSARQGSFSTTRKSPPPQLQKSEGDNIKKIIF